MSMLVLLTIESRVFIDILPFSCSVEDIDGDGILCGEGIGVETCTVFYIVGAGSLLDLGVVVYEELGDERAIVATVSSWHCLHSSAGAGGIPVGQCGLWS